MPVGQAPADRNLQDQNQKRGKGAHKAIETKGKVNARSQRYESGAGGATGPPVIAPDGEDQRSALLPRLAEAVVVANAVAAGDARVAVQRDKVAHQNQQLRQVLKDQKGHAQVHNGGEALHRVCVCVWGGVSQGGAKEGSHWRWHGIHPGTLLRGGPRGATHLEPFAKAVAVLFGLSVVFRLFLFGATRGAEYLRRRQGRHQTLPLSRGTCAARATTGTRGGLQLLPPPPSSQRTALRSITSLQCPQCRRSSVCKRCRRRGKEVNTRCGPLPFWSAVLFHSAPSPPTDVSADMLISSVLPSFGLSCRVSIHHTYAMTIGVITTLMARLACSESGDGAARVGGKGGERHARCKRRPPPHAPTHPFQLLHGLNLLVRDALLPRVGAVVGGARHKAGQIAHGALALAAAVQVGAQDIAKV